jgi:PASTA domain
MTMTDMNERFRAADRIPITEDLWGEILTRQTRGTLPVRSRSGRWVALAAASLIAFAGVGLSLWSLRRTPPSEPNTGQVSVPNVVGQPVERALQALTQLGLKQATEGTFSPTVPDGIVLRQAPSPGVGVKAGSMVRLSVSLGPAPPRNPPIAVTTQELRSSTDTQVILDSPAGLARWTVTDTGAGVCGERVRSLVTSQTLSDHGPCLGNPVLAWRVSTYTIDGTRYHVIAGFAQGTRVRVTFVDGERAIVRTHSTHSWIVVSIGSATNEWGAPMRVETLDSNGGVMARFKVSVIRTGA